jgi:hypothetical protein
MRPRVSRLNTSLVKRSPKAIQVSPGFATTPSVTWADSKAVTSWDTDAENGASGKIDAKARVELGEIRPDGGLQCRRPIFPDSGSRSKRHFAFTESNLQCQAQVGMSYPSGGARRGPVRDSARFWHGSS